MDSAVIPGNAGCREGRELPAHPESRRIFLPSPLLSQAHNLRSVKAHLPPGQMLHTVRGMCLRFPPQSREKKQPFKHTLSYISSFLTAAPPGS